MSIVPVRLVYGELADHIKWNNHADAIEELQDTALVTTWVTATLNSGWAVEASNNIPMQTRGTATTAYLQGIIYTTTSKVAGSAICTIPVDVRPSVLFAGLMDKDAAGVISRHRFNIYPDGRVTTVDARSAGEYFIFNDSWPLG